MTFALVLAWRQLIREKLRLIVAIGGVSFAVILMLMQLGFQGSLFGSATRLHKLLKGDLVVIHRDSHGMQSVKTFPRTSVYQALGNAGVKDVAVVYLGRGGWKNPENFTNRNIFIMGFDPAEDVVDMPDVNAQRDKLKDPEAVLFDSRSRREFGPVASMFSSTGKPVTTEIGTTKVVVTGLYEFGATFIADGNVVTSEEGFLRVTGREEGQIEIGLVRLKPGADVTAVQAELKQTMPETVLVLTKPEFVEKEINFWKKNTAVGFIFGFGVAMGFIVGAVIVYQILYADVSDHMAEYATLKAMGYTNLFLGAVVISEAVILSVLGFLPGASCSFALYRITEKATQLAMPLSPSTGLSVFGLTIFMCCLSGALAVRKVQSADPADVF